jgi:hypothetical protein
MMRGHLFGCHSKRKGGHPPPADSSPTAPTGAEGGRTLDLLHAMQALSQLSYGPGKSVCVARSVIEQRHEASVKRPRRAPGGYPQRSHSRPVIPPRRFAQAFRTGSPAAADTAWRRSASPYISGGPKVPPGIAQPRRKPLISNSPSVSPFDSRIRASIGDSRRCTLSRKFLCGEEIGLTYSRFIVPYPLCSLGCARPEEPYQEMRYHARLS